MSQMIRTYTELQKIKTFEGRYDYLRLDGTLGETTFGFDRYLNQILYSSREWLRVRDAVILRDSGCDLGLDGYEVGGRIIVHHMNPITVEEIEHGSRDIINAEYLICTSPSTHVAIHYGDKKLLPRQLVERRPGDTIPWR